MKGPHRSLRMADRTDASGWTENRSAHQVKPSFGETRTVRFDYVIPTTGSSGALEISVDVSDVLYNIVTRVVVVDVGGAATGTSSKSRGKKK